MQNLDIRILISDYNLKHKDVADEMNISRQHLSRLLRNELTAKNRLRVMAAISKLIENQDFLKQKQKGRRDELMRLSKGELCNIVLDLEEGMGDRNNVEKKI